MADASEQRDALSQACNSWGASFISFQKWRISYDATIAKLFELDPEYAPIITASIDFFKKVNWVKTAAWQHAGKPDKLPKELDQLFSSLAQQNDARVILAHYSFEPAKDGIGFVRTTAKGKLNHINESWSAQKFTELFAELERIEKELASLMDDLKFKEMTWP